MGSSQNKGKNIQKQQALLKEIAFQKEGYDCGCLALPKGEENAEPTELPLNKIVYDIEIVNGIAEVMLSQTYVNKGSKFLELQYRFPISPNGCLHSFAATFSKIRMEGIVKEKEVAKVQYSEAVKMGKRAALGEVNAESKDILTLQIGNLGPGEEVLIELRYTEELGLSLNTFYQFNFVTRHTPRYVNSIPPDDYLNAFRKTVKTVGGNFEWDFRLRVRASRKILAFKCITHQLTVQKKNDACTEYSLTLAKGEAFTKAFSFIYTTEHFELPSYSLGRTDAGSSVMVSFIPKFCGLDLADAELAAVKAEKFEVDMDAARGEYVFVLDRSGSMSGEPIEKAKEALILFLKSLPIDTYFQVVSFGSDSQNMFDKSQKNSNESIEKAIDLIQPINADMGGTQIYAPLESILKSEVIEGYPKQIFLLTDGGVSDTESVIDLVRKSTKYSRVHTIGIGSGVSQALIIGCAEKGKGEHIFIREEEDPSEKIIQLLNDSLTPVISKVTLDYDKTVVESIVPNPQKLPYILKGEVANFYVTFKGQITKPTTISLAYTDSLHNLPFKSSIEIYPDATSEAFVDKMGNFRRIRALEEAEANGGPVEDYLYFVKTMDKKQQIIELSTKHQILSKYTAFICVEKQLVDGRFQQIKSKGQDKVQIVTVNKPPEQLQQMCISRSAAPSFSSMQYSFKCSAAPLKRSAVPMAMEAYCEQQENEQCAMDDYEDQCMAPQMRCMQIQEECLLEAQECQKQCDYSPIIQKGECLPETIKKQQYILQKKSVQKQKAVFTVKEIVKLQLFEGYWGNEAIIQQIYGKQLASEIGGLEDRDAVITYLIVIWIEKHHPEKEYSLIVRKARTWLKKQKRFSEFPVLFNAYLK